MSMERSAEELHAKTCVDRGWPLETFDQTGWGKMELEARIRGHAVRIAAGAKAIDHWGGDAEVGCIVIDGQTYAVPQWALDHARRIAGSIVRSAVWQQCLTTLNVDRVVAMFEEAEFDLKQLALIPEDLVLVRMLGSPNNACVHYRINQPAAWLNRAQKTGGGSLWIDRGAALEMVSASKFDMIVAPRLVDLHYLTMFQALQLQGVAIVYETDDLLSQVPEYNPHRVHATRAAAEVRAQIVDMADALFVSTPELRDALGYPDKTFVLPNAIDTETWRTHERAVEAPDRTPVTIVWQGSPTHSEDLKVAVPALKRILARFKSQVRLAFWGDVPEAFLTSVDKQGRRRVAPKWQGQIMLMPPCDIGEFPERYIEADVDIAIAPLVENPFNQSKSELKVLEAWARGIPVVASAVAPYLRAIDHNVNGLIARDTHEWVTELVRLIGKPSERVRLAEAGRKKLHDRYTMDRMALEYERTILTVVAGQVKRPAAAATIERRLKELS